MFLIFSVLFIALVTFRYSEYLFGGRPYIFTLGAADSNAQTYPWLLYRAREWASGHWMEHWNFSNSLGNGDGVIMPALSSFVIMFGEKHVAYLIGLYQYLKVLLSGFLFYFYLRTMRVSRRSSAIFSVLYAFNPWFTSLSYWQGFSDWQGYSEEALLFTLWLFSFELFFLKDKKKWLPITTAILIMDLGAYESVVYTMTMIAYVIFRIISENHDVIKAVKIFVRFLLFVALGWFMCAVKIIPSFIGVLGSERLQDSLDNQSSYGLISSPKTIATAFLHLFGETIIKVDREDPTFMAEPKFYCGIITIIMIPLAISTFPKLKKKIYIFGFTAVVCYALIVPIRYVSNAFTTDSFHHTSYWIIVLIIITAAQGMEKAVERGISSRYMYITAAIIVILMVISSTMVDTVNSKFKTIIFFIVLYTLLFIVKNAFIKRNIWLILFILTIGEMYTAFGNNTVYPAVYSFWKTKKLFYFDNSKDAIEYIKKNDNDLYRISKDYIYGAPYLCDSLVHDYMGTVGYNGGGGDRNLTGDFYKSLGFPIYRNNHFAYGFDELTSINTLLGVKYIISKNETPCNYGYTLIGQFDDVNLFENNYYLPLSFSYDKYIMRSDFEKLTVSEKRNVIMQALVLENDGNVTKAFEAYDCEKISTPSGDYNIEKYRVDNKSDERTNVEVDPISENDVLIVKISVDNNDPDYYIANPAIINEDCNNVIKYEALDGEHNIHQGFLKGNNTYVYEFVNPGTDKVEFNITEYMDVKEMSIYVMPKEEYYKKYVSCIEKLREKSIKNSHIENNLLEGNYVNDKESLLFFSIPYDKKWHVYVDGTEHELMHANIGFMCSVIEPGNHKIELRYEIDYRYLICSLIGVALYLVCIIIDIIKKCVGNKSDKQMIREEELL